MASAPKALVDRMRLLAIKIQTSPTAAETLTNSECSLIVLNPKIEDQTVKETREKEASLGEEPGVAGVSVGQCTFDIDLSAEATQPTWAGIILPSCGLGFSSTKYLRDFRAPEASGSTQKCVTIGLYQDGVFEEIYNAMGNLVFHCVAGKVVRASATYKGLHTVPTDVAMLTQTKVDPSLLRFMNSAIALGSWNPKVADLELDLGNDVQIREDSSTATGLWHAMIAKFATIAKISQEMNLVADHNAHGKWYAGTQEAFSFSLNSALADSAAIAWTKGEYVDLKKGARHELKTWDCGIKDQNADIGITFTAHA
jgi:hypothetical protein